ncbi:uracil-DNA glycosylase [Falsirhodobacter algicola]|uniref:Type-4 uracil-DNA glycosylase n=1 Tax=Falsirhodobacter algicola TaxID=2692330 RepID=A0A8J8SL45_9RHOB|nr:uracil-DNA glycosylase [Falsirhodobacter algicola]QUS36640.1 uracil-DNA glycosylase [Falsirhodobacter algicola]
MTRDACDLASDLDWETAAAMLAWQYDLGATEGIGDVPLNRYELEAAAPKPAPSAAHAPPAAPPAPAADPAAEARAIAAAAPDLAALRDAMAGFTLCELKRGARNTVFADGRAGARVMIIGEAPGRNEDIAGKPFVGQAGQFLDRMMAAIGLSRDAEDAAHGFYVTNVLPWRPPSDRDPTAEEVALMLPFLERHVALAQPDLLVVLGNTAARAVLGQGGITRLRGTWGQGFGRPVMPMCHPAHLLRHPLAKREAWSDLLQIKSRLR